MLRVTVPPGCHSQGTLPGEIHSEEIPYTPTSGQIRTHFLATGRALAFFVHNYCILGGYLTLVVSLSPVLEPQHIPLDGQPHKQKICVSYAIEDRLNLHPVPFSDLMLVRTFVFSERDRMLYPQYHLYLSIFHPIRYIFTY